MKLSWKEVTKIALSLLTAGERRDSAVYLDEVERAKDSVVFLGKQEMRMPWDGAVVFVDGEPALNWGHRCRYILVDLATGGTRSIEAQFPPFLRGAPETLRLIWKGENVPEWALAAR